MAKPLKIVLIVIGVVFALLVGVAIALPLFFDPNDYRDQIRSAAKDATGRELQLGDIKLSVFPWIAVKLKDVSLGNAEGFGPEPFAQLAEADASVRLIPLFSGKIEIGTVSVKGLHANLAKDKTGKDNWSDLSKKDAKPEEAKPEEPKAPGQFKLEDLHLGGVEIEDALLSYADAQAGKSYKVEKLNLKTGALEPDKPFDIKLGVTVTSTAPQMKADLELDSSLSLKLPKVSLDQLTFKVNAELQDLKATATLTGAATGDLDTQVFDVSSLKLDGTASGKSIPGGEQKLSLAGTLHFDAKQGAMKIAGMTLQAAGLTVTSDITGENLLGDAPKVYGPIKLQQFSPRDLLAKLGMPMQTADAEALKTMAFSADFSGGAKSATLSNMNLTLDQTKATGNVNVRDFATQAVDFAFKVDQLDADRYLPPPSKESPKQAPVQDGKKPDMNEMALPSEALNNLNVQGTLDVGMFKLSNIKMTNAQVKLAGGKGQVKNQTISAKLYGGSVSFNHRYTPGAKPGYNARVQLSGLQAAPFLKDFMGKDYVDGLANFNLDAGGNGLKLGDVIKTLNGNTDFKVENGAVKGFNIASMVRKARATMKGDLNYTETEPKQTDFTAMTGSAKIVNGVINADSLNATSPAFRVTGAGTIDLVHQTIDYLAKPTVVDTSKGQGGKELADLKGITIPIRVSGNLFAPGYKLDIAEALKQQAMTKLTDKVSDKLGVDKLNDKLTEGLSKLFKKK